MKFVLCILVSLLGSTVYGWENLPQLPSGRKSEYFLVERDGGYKYGFDTGKGSFAKQSADSKNQVEGHFAFPSGGSLVDVKYKAGVEGFVPQLPSNLAATRIQPAAVISQQSKIAQESNGNSDGSYKFSYKTNDAAREESSDPAGNVKGRYSFRNDAGTHDLSYEAGPEQGFVVKGGSLAIPNGLDGGNAVRLLSQVSKSAPGDKLDGSYSFSYRSDDSSRQESGDSLGRVTGSYSYANPAGKFDLTYKAGAETGFQVTGGNLVPPTILSSVKAVPDSKRVDAQSSSEGSGDPSYAFSYATDQSSREESSDAGGNVKGRFSYSDEAGRHDLSYTANDNTGFIVTGGNLAAPTSLQQKSTSLSSFSNQNPGTKQGGNIQESSSLNKDGSYKFSYNTGNLAHEQSSDSTGNVRGRYGYTNEAGNHDLSYEAGPEKGFMVTGGSLASPGGLSPEALKQIAALPLKTLPNPKSDVPILKQSSDIKKDGSYSFSYTSEDSSREESSDQAGNVKGRYGYKNDAGLHDLSYEAGAEKGFIVTGGSLSQPNGLSLEAQRRIASNPVPPLPKAKVPILKQSSDMKDDGSYSFSYASPDSSREESSDASGNVRGRFSYNNEAGVHDLSYEAGAEKGFLVTGGNLAAPTKDSIIPIPVARIPIPEARIPIPVARIPLPGKSDRTINPDGSYSFSYSTGTSSRQEQADSAGNVQGRFSFQNDAGNHDLSYEAGAERGFVVKGGSLSIPNGLDGGNAVRLLKSHAESLVQKSAQPNREYLPPVTSKISNLPSHQSNVKTIEFSPENLKITKYLPVPENHKVGYILDS